MKANPPALTGSLKAHLLLYCVNTLHETDLSSTESYTANVLVRSLGQNPPDADLPLEVGSHSLQLSPDLLSSGAGELSWGATVM